MNLFAYLIWLYILTYVESRINLNDNLNINKKSSNNHQLVALNHNYPHNPYQSSTTSSSNSFKIVPQYEKRTINDFLTRDSRLGFIRKVYLILSTQMITTIFITYLIMANSNLAYFLYKNYQTLSISSGLLSLGIIFTLVSNANLRYKMPYNFILLGIHTILQSIMVGTFSSLMNPKTVCIGAMYTLTTFLSITLYSFQPNPKYDLTLTGNTLLTILTSLVFGSIFNIFFKLSLLDNIISGALAVLFAVYLFYDTQKIIGGTHHKHSYSQKEYILAALNLYQDILNLYIQIVKILNSNNKRSNNRD